MSDRPEDTTTQEAAEAGSESAVSPAETEAEATAESQQATAESAVAAEPATGGTEGSDEGAAETAAADAADTAEPTEEAPTETTESAPELQAEATEPVAEATEPDEAAQEAEPEAEATQEAEPAAEAAPETPASDEAVEASAPETPEEVAKGEDSSEEAATEASPATAEAAEQAEEAVAEVEQVDAEQADAESAASGASPAAEASTDSEPSTESAAAASDEAAESAEAAPAAEAASTEAGDGDEADQAAILSKNEDSSKDAGSAAATPEVKAETSEAMAELAKAMEDKSLVKGQVIGWNKGGYHVAIGKIAAFCPVSQIEIGNPRGPKRYLDKTFPFRVIEIQNGGRRVVLSRAEAIKAEREQRAALVRELLQPGAELEGKVSSLTNFGAFVDLGGGIEGLVHVSEISRRRVEHPKEALRNGQKVKVTVLKIEKGGQRISLSMKRLEPDPWKGVAERFSPGSNFTGKIVRHTEFGLFVEVEPGLEGLIHTSRLALGQSMTDESLEVGKEITGWIHEVEAKRRRLSLSLREVSGTNPWHGVGDRYPIGELTKGTVERLASFGVFIQLEPGLTGLLPFSLLGGSGAPGNPRRQYHAGKEVSVRVLSIDRDRKRISLGTEQSKAEGNQQDYREYVRRKKETTGGLNAMAAAFAKLKEQQTQPVQK
ncbi:MAG: S1 RNA-binding domain-containing protein [Acidobacteriota bacterium]